MRRVRSEAVQAEAEIMAAVDGGAGVLGDTTALEQIVAEQEGVLELPSMPSRNNSGLTIGMRVEVSFGAQWVKGTLEQELSGDLGLWNIGFDDGINQTMTLTSDTVGAEWRLEGDGSGAGAGAGAGARAGAGTGAGGDGGDPSATRAREDLPEVLVMGMRIEAKYRRSARYFGGVIVGVNADDDTYSVKFDDGDFDPCVPRSRMRGVKVRAGGEPWLVVSAAFCPFCPHFSLYPSFTHTHTRMRTFAPPPHARPSTSCSRRRSGRCRGRSSGRHTR